MATTAMNVAELLKGIPEGAWVAISEDAHKVVAYSADLQTTLKTARENGEDDPLIVRIPEQSSVLFL
ncbi:MAG TPA: DUF5678 domain-containing protein [Terracidiphilus sp.]|jgi:hypothetical protein